MLGTRTAPWLTGFPRRNRDLLWAYEFDTSNYQSDIENASDFLRTSLENKWSMSKILLNETEYRKAATMAEDNVTGGWTKQYCRETKPG